jgi:diguanylate cyclase (GGDEF)-like protein/excisionase family DNA binding protein
VEAVKTSPKWIRVQQAAELLGISASTVRRWADSGRVASRRTPSGQRRFAADDLRRLLADEAALEDLRGEAQDTAEQRYRLLLETSLELASTLDTSQVLQSAARRLCAALDIPDCDIYRLEDGKRMVCLASCIQGHFDAAWVGRELNLEHWPLNRQAIETRQAVTVGSVNDPRLCDMERDDLLTYGQKSFLAMPLIAKDKVIGLVELLDRRERRFTEAEIALAEGASQLVALALEHARLYAEVRRLHVGNLRALSSALSAKDYYTLGHAARVAGYMGLLGRELGWSEEHIQDVQDVAFLHDIGKIGISDRVLLKAGPLTSEEWELMRQHPGISAEIVHSLIEDELVHAVHYHHERFDGSGYPDGLAGEAIPEVARAMCVVDCYDAMSCERPYRRALTYHECLGELRRCSGTQFDPDMVTAFCAALKRLQRRRNRVVALARGAAASIDPLEHAKLRTRADESTPQYKKMVATLRELRAAHPSVRFVTTFALVGDQCITVLDTGEIEADVSHCGDEWLAHDELAKVLAGESLQANVLNADEFGVWVSGIAPLLGCDGSVVGVVNVDATAVESVRERLQGDRSHTLAATLRAAAIRFSRAELEAITDGLTGLYNHRYLHERFEEELQRAVQRKSHIALLFCDCDEFKQYNDLYGHKAGDAALGRIARIIEACSRRTDVAGRYGGEEFVLVLVDTDEAGALTVAERIRAEVASSSHAGGRPLTVSIGVATYPDDGAARDELLDKADWAMYAAKRSGRNCVLAFSSDIVREETWLSRRGR